MIPRFYRLLKYTPGSEVRPVAEISKAFPVQSSFENYKADSREELLSKQNALLATHPKESTPEINKTENTSTYSNQKVSQPANEQNRILPFWEKNQLAHHMLSSHWLVAYDGSPAADRLWTRAIHLAKAFKAKVSGLYVQTNQRQRQRRGEGEAPAALPMEGATLAPVIDLPQGIEKLISNQIIKTILQNASEKGVSLIWLGTHARKGKERVKKGSVAETILKESTCPVWLYKENENLEIQKILVPIARMTESHFVIEEALKFAQHFKASLYFLHVNDAQGENFSLPNLNLEAEWFHEKGDVAESIVKTAEKISADLIIMRTHPERAEEQMLPSGVTPEVLRFSPCSMLIIQ